MILIKNKLNYSTHCIISYDIKDSKKVVGGIAGHPIINAKGYILSIFDNRKEFYGFKLFNLYIANREIKKGTFEFPNYGELYRLMFNYMGILKSPPIYS